MEPKYIFFWENEVFIDTHLTNALFVEQQDFTVIDCRLLGTKWRDLCGRPTGLLVERAWMLRILFQKSYLRFVIIERLSQRGNTTSLWIDSPVTLTKLLYIIMSNFGRTVAISLNPFFLEFRPKMRKRTVRMNHLRAFQACMNVYSVTSRGDDIVRRFRDLRAELCALGTTILPGPFANDLLYYSTARLRRANGLRVE